MLRDKSPSPNILGMFDAFESCPKGQTVSVDIVLEKANGGDIGECTIIYI